MVKNNDSMQQCSHGSATSEKFLLEIKRILTKILFVWLEICAQSPGVWISEPGHDLGGIAADVIFSTKHNPDTLNILPTFKVQIQGV